MRFRKKPPVISVVVEAPLPVYEPGQVVWALYGYDYTPFHVLRQEDRKVFIQTGHMTAVWRDIDEVRPYDEKLSGKYRRV